MLLLNTNRIPSALGRFDEMIAPACGNQVAVFLDYDGTLTPIVSQPEEALLANSMREALQELASRVPVAILSGRDLDDVRARVNIENIVYAGSHGFDIAGPDGLRRQIASEFLPKLDTAEKKLQAALTGIAGARVERKRLSIATHYRNVNEKDVPKVKQAVGEVAWCHRELRKMTGKKVHELQPDIDWDKGRALTWLLETLGLEGENVFPIYIGDDRTDEDAFWALKSHGVGILVSEQSRPTAATYSLRNPDEVEEFLRAITAREDGASRKK
jgi:trehalose 6-phosphate phosphatase